MMLWLAASALVASASASFVHPQYLMMNKVILVATPRAVPGLVASRSCAQAPPVCPQLSVLNLHRNLLPGVRLLGPRGVAAGHTLLLHARVFSASA
jgi:hypothetical protein